MDQKHLRQPGRLERSRACAHARECRGSVVRGFPRGGGPHVASELCRALHAARGRVANSVLDPAPDASRHRLDPRRKDERGRGRGGVQIHQERRVAGRVVTTETRRPLRSKGPDPEAEELQRERCGPAGLATARRSTANRAHETRARGQWRRSSEREAGGAHDVNGAAQPSAKQGTRTRGRWRRSSGREGGRAHGGAVLHLGHGKPCPYRRGERCDGYE